MSIRQKLKPAIITDVTSLLYKSCNRTCNIVQLNIT